MSCSGLPRVSADDVLARLVSGVQCGRRPTRSAAREAAEVGLAAQVGRVDITVEVVAVVESGCRNSCLTVRGAADVGLHAHLAVAGDESTAPRALSGRCIAAGPLPLRAVHL